MGQRKMEAREAIDEAIRILERPWTVPRGRYQAQHKGVNNWGKVIQHKNPGKQTPGKSLLGPRVSCMGFGLKGKEGGYN